MQVLSDKYEHKQQMIDYVDPIVGKRPGLQRDLLKVNEDLLETYKE